MDFWFLCKNARLKRDGRIAELLAESSRLKWDVICFSETRTECSDLTLLGGHRLVCTNSIKCSGVAILIYTRWTSAVVNVQRISDRVMFVDLQIHTLICRFVSVYVPHAGYTRAEFESCISLMREAVLEGQGKGFKCIVGGDFNTDIRRGSRSVHIF